MARCQDRDALERSAGANRRRLVESGGDELKCDRQSRLGETARQRDRRWPVNSKRQMYRCNLAMSSGCSPSVRIMAEGRRRERMQPGSAQVDRAE